KKTSASPTATSFVASAFFAFSLVSAAEAVALSFPDARAMRLASSSSDIRVRMAVPSASGNVALSPLPSSAAPSERSRFQRRRSQRRRLSAHGPRRRAGNPPGRLGLGGRRRVRVEGVGGSFVEEALVALRRLERSLPLSLDEALVVLVLLAQDIHRDRAHLE